MKPKGPLTHVADFVHNRDTGGIYGVASPKKYGPVLEDTIVGCAALQLIRHCGPCLCRGVESAIVSRSVQVMKDGMARLPHGVNVQRGVTAFSKCQRDVVLYGCSYFQIVVPSPRSATCCKASSTLIDIPLLISCADSLYEVEPKPHRPESIVQNLHLCRYSCITGSSQLEQSSIALHELLWADCLEYT